MTEPNSASRFVWHGGDLVPVEPGQPPPARKTDRIPPRQRGNEAPTLPALPLAQIRRARQITQAQLADRLGVDQAQVSRLEGRGDYRFSTVVGYLRELGLEELELTLQFADGTVMEIPVDVGRD